MIRLAEGRSDEAADHVRKALAAPALAQYEARLAQCELAVLRDDPEAPALVDDALGLAAAGGHAVSAQRLVQLRDLSAG